MPVLNMFIPMHGRDREVLAALANRRPGPVGGPGDSGRRGLFRRRAEAGDLDVRLDCVARAALRQWRVMGNFDGPRINHIELIRWVPDVEGAKEAFSELGPPADHRWYIRVRDDDPGNAWVITDPDCDHDDELHNPDSVAELPPTII